MPRPTRRPSRGLVLAALLLLTGCKVDLYTKLSEREANEMVAVLLQAGIDAGRAVAKDGSSVVQVEKARLADAVGLLRANMLPREQFANLGDVFAQQGLVSSPTAERARFIYALSQELSRTISDIDGVLSARIHVVLPRNDPLRQDGAPAAASVFIRHDARATIGEIVPQIKMLVANSIEGLSYDRVSLVLLPVERTRPNTPPAPPGANAVDSIPLAAPLAAGGLAAAALGGGGLFLWRRRRVALPEAAAVRPLPRPAARAAP